MKKRTIKAFTLVEMLIVIVIIGILIAALMPRMQAAQGRARDVSRKTALSQVQSAIVTSQGDNGRWPGQCEGTSKTTNCAENGTGLGEVETELTRAGMNSVPLDPLKSDDLKGLGAFEGNAAGDYAYMITTRNGTPNGGFVLMAKTEVEGSSNWVVCDGKGTDADKFKYGRIPEGKDITEIHPCTKFEKNETTATTCEILADGTCKYDSDGELRYIVLY